MVEGAPMPHQLERRLEIELAAVGRVVEFPGSLLLEAGARQLVMFPVPV